MRYREAFNAIKDSFNVVAIGLSKLHEGEYQLHKLPEDSLMVKENDYLIIVVKTRNAKVIAKYLGVSEGLT